MGIKSSRTTPSPLRGEGWGEGDIGRQSGNTPHLNPLPQGERKEGNQEGTIKSSRTTPSPLRGEGWGEGEIRKKM